MTAHGLIDSIFSKPHSGKLPGNMRFITPAQLKYLRDLIGQDEEGGAVRRGDGDRWCGRRAGGRNT